MSDFGGIVFEASAFILRRSTEEEEIVLAAGDENYGKMVVFLKREKLSHVVERRHTKRASSTQ